MHHADDGIIVGRMIDEGF